MSPGETGIPLSCVIPKCLASKAGKPKQTRKDGGDACGENNLQHPPAPHVEYFAGPHQVQTQHPHSPRRRMGGPAPLIQSSGVYNQSESIVFFSTENMPSAAEALVPNPIMLRFPCLVKTNHTTSDFYSALDPCTYLRAPRSPQPPHTLRLITSLGM